MLCTLLPSFWVYNERGWKRNSQTEALSSLFHVLIFQFNRFTKKKIAFPLRPSFPIFPHLSTRWFPTLKLLLAQVWLQCPMLPAVCCQCNAQTQQIAQQWRSVDPSHSHLRPVGFWGGFFGRFCVKKEKTCKKKSSTKIEDQSRSN